MWAKQALRIKDAENRIGALDVTIAKSNTELEAIKAGVLAETTIHAMACSSFRFEEINLWYSCTQNAVDNFALGHYGEGTAAFERWYFEYERCGTEADASVSTIIRGAVCTA